MEEYILVRWPESQDFMDLPWFQKESSLADEELAGPAAYFIPKDRYLEVKPYQL